MVWRFKEQVNHNHYQHLAVISPCSYTWLGMEDILRQQGCYAMRINHGSEEITEDEATIINAGERTHLMFFLQGDLCSVLATLKKAVMLLDHAPGRNHVTFFSLLPARWLYSMLRSLVKNKGKVEDIRISSLQNSCYGLIHEHLPRIGSVVGAEARLSMNSSTGLSIRELDAVLNYYLGKSVKLQSSNSGLAGKTIYTHRQRGLKKLSGVEQWLNDAMVARGRHQRIRRQPCSGGER